MGKVWWRWGRRKERPRAPHSGHRERWWSWLALVRDLVEMAADNYREGWLRRWRVELWRQRAMEARQRQEKVRTVGIMQCSGWWTCKTCGPVGRKTTGFMGCANAVRSIVDE